MNSLRLVPSMLTAGNLFFGFMSIIETMNRNYELAASMLFVSLMLDTLDGRVARKLNQATDFGVQFDSLADLISFGVAPSIFALNVYLAGTGLFGLIAASLFVLAGAIRLARYNTLPKTPYFVGLPIPTAGLTLVLIHLSKIVLATKHMIFIMILLSFLMISKIKYANFNIVLSRPKEYFRTHAKSKYFVIFVIGLASLLIVELSIDPAKLLLVPFIYYIIVGPILALRD